MEVFPRGFEDPRYLGWERDYKSRAHTAWDERLDPVTFRALLREGRASEIAASTTWFTAEGGCRYEDSAYPHLPAPPAGAAGRGRNFLGARS